MKRTLLFSTALLAISFTGLTPALASAPSQQVPRTSVDRYSDGLRRWTPRDSTRMRRFSSATLAVHSGIGSDAIYVSPSGDHFAFVAEASNPDCTCQLATLNVYSVEQLTQALGSSGSYAPTFTYAAKGKTMPALRQIQWKDGQTLIFTAVDLSSTQQVYAMDLLTGDTRKLTEAPRGASAVNYQESGGSSLYGVVSQSVKPSSPSRPPFAWSAPKLHKSAGDGYDRSEELEIFIDWKGQNPRALKSRVVAGNTPLLSPGGRYAAGLRKAAMRPGWKNFDNIENIAADLLKEPFLIDLEKGTERPLFDAPLGEVTTTGAKGREPNFFWSLDGKSLVLVNTALPFEPGKQERKKLAYIASYDVATGGFAELEPLISSEQIAVADVSWLQQGRELLVTHAKSDGTPAPGTIYRYDQGQWRPRSAGIDVQRTAPGGRVDDLSQVPRQMITLKNGLKVELRQNADLPAQIVASWQNKEYLLTDPDPALKGLWFAKTIEVSWFDGDGNRQKGGLLLPRDLPARGGRMPLVIQAEPHLPREFNPDGAAPPLSAQALVAQGIAVLNIGFPQFSEHTINEANSGRMARLFTNWVEEASLEVAKNYPVDLDRVGIIGFSLTGFLSRYAATFATRVRPVAAIIADSDPQTYSSYISHCALPSGCNRGMELHHGGEFFEEKGSWFATDVEFNLDRTRAATLFADYGAKAYRNISISGSFIAARRPFEVLALPAHSEKYPFLTTHGPNIAHFREVSQNLTVDWFSFWLLDKETIRVEDPDRYLRWRKIRKDWQAQQAWEARGYPAGSQPGDAAAINRAAYKALYVEKDVAKAIRFLEDNVRLNPKAGFAYDSLGEGYIQAGDLPKAVEAYQKAAVLDPKNNPNAVRILHLLKTAPEKLKDVQQKLRNDFAAYDKYANGPIGPAPAAPR